MANPLYPTQGTNKWRMNTGGVPTSMLPSPQETFFGTPGKDFPQAVEPMVPAVAHTPSTPATFRLPPSSTAVPTTPKVAGNLDINGNPTTGPMSGMSVEGGAKATIDPATGQIARNAAWRSMPVGDGRNGTIQGVGGSLNVMPSTQNAALSPQGAAPMVAGGGDAAAFREQLSSTLKQALKNASATVGAPGDIGHRAQWMALAGNIANQLQGGYAAQDTNRVAAGELEVKQAMLPSEIEKNRAVSGYYGTRGAAAEESAATKQQLADQQLEIAGIKAGAGKYGDVNIAAEELRAKGLSPTPENIEAFSKGYRITPGQKESKGTWWKGFSDKAPAIAPHMVPKDWVPTGKMLDGKPVYKDAKGNLQTPDNI